SGTGETPPAFTPRRLTARPAESEHLEGKSTTPHYLVNSNKVCENSQIKKPVLLRRLAFFHLKKIQRFAFSLCKSLSRSAFALCIRFSDGEAEGTGMLTLSGFLFIF
ncbi:hypothetical protein ACIQX3_26120, partial [Peribacillus frigoritolerans]